MVNGLRFFLVLLISLPGLDARSLSTQNGTLDLGNRRELFVDHNLIDQVMSVPMT